MNNSLTKIKTDIYYLNISELKKISNLLQSDFYYWVETRNAHLVRGRPDKKINIINNIIRVLTGKKSVPTIIPVKVVRFGKLIRPTKQMPVYYGQYINGNKQIFDLMKKLTGGKFKFGVVAQDILLSYWKRGRTITFGQLAKLYVGYGQRSHPEWKYIEYVRSVGSRAGWKGVRKERAGVVMGLIMKVMARHE